MHHSIVSILNRSTDTLIYAETTSFPRAVPAVDFLDDGALILLESPRQARLFDTRSFHSFMVDALESIAGSTPTAGNQSDISEGHKPPLVKGSCSLYDLRFLVNAEKEEEGFSLVKGREVARDFVSPSSSTLVRIEPETLVPPPLADEFLSRLRFANLNVY